MMLISPRSTLISCGRGVPEEFANLCRLPRPGRGRVFRIVHGGPKFKRLKTPAVAADTILSVQNRTRAPQLYHQRNNNHQRQGNYQKDTRYQKISYASDRLQTMLNALRSRRVYCSTNRFL